MFFDIDIQSILTIKNFGSCENKQKVEMKSHTCYKISL
ncbi:MAG: hypothetical protein PG977_000881 [Bartonella clarridgeiae]|nr:MAG: hypothetical protein PG977_000881 [Bartonella clarridgeiae]